MKVVDSAGGDPWVTPQSVALAMLDLIEKDQCEAGKINGGTVLEVGKDRLRLVHERNDPGPSGPGTTVPGHDQAVAEIFETLKKDLEGVT